MTIPAEQLAAAVSDEGVLPSDVVAHVLEDESLDVEALMLRLLPLAAQFSNAPVSGFAVGAVARGESRDGRPGSLYLGANLEFRSAGAAATIHAEQSAVNNAWLHSEPAVEAIAVTAAPCGHCRQFLHELLGADRLQILTPTNGSGPNPSYTNRFLSELLPQPFGPSDLNVTDRLLKTTNRTLSVDSRDPLVLQAAAAAGASYAPYTGNLAGVAITCRSGRVVCGRTAENAAFNPALSPLGSALSALSLRTDARDDLDVQDAVLVEVPTVSSHRSMTEALLGSIAPDVKLRYFEATTD